MSGHISSRSPKPRLLNGGKSSSYTVIRRSEPASGKASARNSRGVVSHHQSSSADSDIEIMIDQDFVEVPHSNHRIERQSRLRTRENPNTARSRGHSLDNLISVAEHSTAAQERYYNSHDNGYDELLDGASDPATNWPHDFRHNEIATQQPQSHHRRVRTEEMPVVHTRQGRNSHPASEVHELQMRISQMDKTLRWWSDCTANWREKWTKVRAERNRARDELKKAKSTLEANTKELTVLREQKSVLVKENSFLKQELAIKSKEELSEDTSSFSETPRLQQEPDSGTASSRSFKGESLPYRKGGNKSSASGSNASAPVDEDQLTQKVAALQLRVDESVKTVQAERNSKLTLHKSIESLEQELSVCKQKYEEVKDAKQDAMKQLARIQDSHRSELARINQNLEEELENRSQMERKIHDLREEIEKLQEENTSEWGRRERLETEKLQLERENKRLKTSADEMKAEMERRRKSSAEDRDNELRQAHADLRDLNEGLSDLKRQYAKDQKLLEDKQEELAHSKRRAEQHEAEVRSLRMRVEEIKKLQTTTEDELDNSQNQTRKLTRLIEEKDEELEKVHLQIDQLQSRLRREQTATPSWSKPTYPRRDTTDNGNLSSDSCSDV